jgi:hypothetical protein
MSFGDLKVQDLIYEDSSNNEITVVIADLATKANPIFSGTVTVPTATAGDNSTKAASTAFVVASFAPKNAPAFTGSATGVNLTLSGDLTVNGTTTTINTTTLQVEDKNIEIGKVASPSDTTADGGGWTLLGATNKTFNWLNATDSWTSSEHIEIASGKNLKVDGTTFFVDGTNNRIGIGLTNPQRTLHLSSNNTVIALTDTAASTDQKTKYMLSDAGIFAIGKLNDAYDTAVEHLRIDNSGHVLIGATSWSYPKKLNIESTTGDLLSLSSGGTTSGAADTGPNIEFKAHNGSALVGMAELNVLKENATSGNNASYMQFKIRPAGGSTTERFRLASSGQIGIGGANYGTSGQVLTSGGSGAAPSWAAVPAGGNTFTAVANGSIANNKAVKIDTDGKVSEINESTTLITSSLVNSATGILYLASQNAYQKNNRLAYSPDDDLTVQVYADGGSPYYHKSGLWKTHSSSPGEVQQIGSHTTIHSVGSNADGNNDICYLSSSRFVYVYNRNDSMRCRVAVGTISGSGDSRTISWSNDQQLDGLSTSFYSSYKIRKIGTNRVAVFAVAGNNNCRWSDGKPGILIADVSSSTVTYRSSSILVSQNADIEFDRCSLAYNSTDDLLLAGWRRNSSNHYYRAIKVASGTSATITLTSSQYEISENNYKRNIVWHPTQNKFVLVYNQEASNNGEIDTRVFTVNSSSLAISVTSVYTLPSSGNKADQGLFTLVTALNSIQIKTIGSNRQPYTYADDSFNGTAFNIDREGKTTTGFDGNLEICVQSVCLSEDPNQTILSVYGSTTSATYNKPSAITVKSANVTSNLTDASQYVGYTDQAYTNGQTATIKTYGNNVDTLSGLTAGTLYYLQGDGTVGTSSGFPSFATNTPLAGTALSATKLLIRDPLAKT